MPARWLLAPDGKTISFEDAPGFFEAAGIMPSYAVEAIIHEYTDDVGSFNVRPSDVNPKFTCRRQRVWMSNHDYGVNPLEAEGMVEGSAFHSQLGAHEIEVPTQHTTDLLFVGSDGEMVDKNGPNRIPVCGVPMRGRIDWLFEDRIEDLKTSTPFWIAKFPTKEQKERDPSLRPYAEIWQPKDDADDIQGWCIQLSLYRILLQKSGQEAPAMGRVWRRYSGVKADKPRWRRFDFPLMDEPELEGLVGDWMRGLQTALLLAQAGDLEAWKSAAADGREMIGGRGNMWKCDRCPLKQDCFKQDELAVF